MSSRVASGRVVVLVALLFSAAGLMVSVTWGSTPIDLEGGVPMTAADRQNLEDVRYVVWLDKAIRDGDIEDYDGPRWPFRPHLETP
ncbi:MAG: hypothetical protein VYE73_13690 [Acidobacteriota bacterium]|nr:hypothetical protein [Acidobacteriota bacterium]